jgi:small-conductance mechanosensitive channel
LPRTVLQRLLLASILFFLALPPAWAQTPTATPAHAPAAAQTQTVITQTVTPAEAQQALSVLQDDKKRSQLIDTLRTIAAASAPVVTAAPAAPAPATVAKPVVPLAPNGLGAALLLATSEWFKTSAATVAGAVRGLTHFPGLYRWAVHRLSDPDIRLALLDGGWKFLVVAVLSLATEWLVGKVLSRPLAKLQARLPADPSGQAEQGENGAAPVETPEVFDTPEMSLSRRRRGFNRLWRRVKRLPLALVALVLELLPVAGFAAMGNLLLGVAVEVSDTSRLVILGLLYAYVTCRCIMCAARFLVAPQASGLRLLPVSDQTAAYIEVWVRRIVGVTVFGVALVDVAQLMGLHAPAREALLKLIMLVVHLFLVIIVLQCRQGVATWLHAKGKRGLLALLRNRLADLWHYVAIFFILALWVVWAFGLKDGYARLLHFTIATAVVLVGARLVSIAALGALDRGFQIRPDLVERFPGLEARANRYYPLLRGAVAVLLGLITVIVLLEVWGLDALVWFESGAIGGRLVSAGLTIVIAAVVAVAVWEGANAAIDRHMRRLSNRAEYGRSARLRTLLPMLRTALLILILVIVGLTVLSEIGVNIAPLLASAGILGIAIGFGSQKLVQDLITGLFLLLEDAMQVGDAVTVAGLSGTVEHLSIRTIRLRAGDGSVHIIPFSAVTTVNNTNRGVGNAAVSVQVAYDEDTDRVGEAMKEIALEMRAEDAFKGMMLSDLQLWGVDKVDGASATLVGQIVCTDAGRWGVQREYNRRIKKRFQELGIGIANPVQTVLLRTLPDEEAAPAPEAHADGAEGKTRNPATVKESPPPSALGHDQ